MNPRRCKRVYDDDQGMQKTTIGIADTRKDSTGSGKNTCLIC